MSLLVDCLPDKHREDPLRYLRISTIRSFKQGENIYTPGDPAKNIFLIISGKVKVGRLLRDGHDVVIGVYEPDSFFGESALIESCRSGSASALETTRLMSWTTEQIQAIGAENPKLLYALLQMITARLRAFEDRIESFTVEDVRSRLARALMEFSRGSAEGPAARIAPLTHELLASYVGTSREVVTQLMNRFRRMGYLDYSRKGILIFRDQIKLLLSEEKDSIPARPPSASSDEGKKMARSQACG